MPPARYSMRSKCNVQSKALALIKSSASLSRGVIEHSKFGGRLEVVRSATEVSNYVIDPVAHMITSDSTDLGSGATTGISFPFLSLALVTLNTDKTEAVMTKSSASTKCRPGHIRLPAPNASVRMGSSRKVPSSLRKRSGLNSSGSGYNSGSCRTALSVCLKTVCGATVPNDCRAP